MDCGLCSLTLHGFENIKSYTVENIKSNTVIRNVNFFLIWKLENAMDFI